MIIIDKTSDNIIELENEYRNSGHIELEDFFYVYFVKKEDIDSISITGMDITYDCNDIDRCSLMITVCGYKFEAGLVGLPFQNACKILIDVSIHAVAEYLKHKKNSDPGFYKNIFRIFDKYLTDSDRLYLESI